LLLLCKQKQSLPWPLASFLQEKKASFLQEKKAREQRNDENLSEIFNSANSMRSTTLSCEAKGSSRLRVKKNLRTMVKR